MGRRQNKNSLNNRKTNMTPPESRDSTPARSEKLDTKDEEVMDLKNYLRKMIETFKEATRKSLKEKEEKASKKLHEMEEKTNQKIQEINKSLKESNETQEKTTKQVKETLKTVQGMKAEIDTIKKTQNEAMLEMERLDKRSGTKDVNITNRIQEMEKRISAIEDSLEDIHSSTKENLKSNKSLTQNIQEIWDTVKRPNLRIIGVEEGEETLLKDTINERKTVPDTGSLADYLVLVSLLAMIIPFAGPNSCCQCPLQGWFGLTKEFKPTMANNMHNSIQFTNNRAWTQTECSVRFKGLYTFPGLDSKMQHSYQDPAELGEQFKEKCSCFQVH
ncbi:Transposase, L1 containing protein [Cricetulus griseus]|nr:Transposase, L1 containing protein [Cricetulus griseus]